MADKILRRIWPVGLIVEGVCTVAPGALDITGPGLGKVLVPRPCVVMLFAVGAMPVAMAQFRKRRRK